MAIRDHHSKIALILLTTTSFPFLTLPNSNFLITTPLFHNFLKSVVLPQSCSPVLMPLRVWKFTSLYVISSKELGLPSVSNVFTELLASWRQFSWEPLMQPVYDANAPESLTIFNSSTNTTPHCPIRHTRYLLFAARQDSPPAGDFSSCIFPYPNALEVHITSFQAPSSEAILSRWTLKNWAMFSFRKANAFSISRFGGSKEKSHSLTPEALSVGSAAGAQVLAVLVTALWSCVEAFRGTPLP